MSELLKIDFGFKYKIAQIEIAGLPDIWHWG